MAEVSPKFKSQLLFLEESINKFAKKYNLTSIFIDHPSLVDIFRIIQFIYLQSLTNYQKED